MGREIAKEHLAYIAGFFDGEGHCGIGHSLNKAGYHAWSINIQITNTNKRVLDWIKDKLGFGIINTRKHKNNDHWKDAFVLEIHYQHQELFLVLLLPFLIVKAEQAKLVLEYIRLGKFGKNVPDNIQIERELIYEELKVLNKRGKAT